MKARALRQAAVVLVVLVGAVPAVQAQGGSYEGEYRDGKRHGQGVETYPDGARYEGEWRDGKLHGRGVLILLSGTRWESEFRNGELQD